ncbi:MAG TPA: prenyltransferase/squalene oxidase repeat-containing protein [Terriglobia bacterium]|nr:prenyltransferase/squalene oxidase repeat-containing protein [Terriglobia bacterium]
MSCSSEAGAPASRPACFAASRGVPYLLAHQNSDGGWGYFPGSQSSVEATCWALIALQAATADSNLRNALDAGCTMLRQAQLPDGSWPPFAGRPQGCWTTSLACLALNAHGKAPERVARGLQWLLATWPAEGGLGWRLRRRLFSRSAVVRQNPALRGWSWTPATASWVEPTAYALILLRSLGETPLPARAARRREMGERMLYDRMCPGGGWNSGNPLVYGVGGIPRVGPTVWALLALARYRERPENRQSADWLENEFAHIRGPASLALAHLCLTRYGRVVPPLEPAIEAVEAASGPRQHLLLNAWATIASAHNFPSS